VSQPLGQGEGGGGGRHANVVVVIAPAVVGARVKVAQDPSVQAVLVQTRAQNGVFASLRTQAEPVAHTGEQAEGTGRQTFVDVVDPAGV